MKTTSEAKGSWLGTLLAAQPHDMAQRSRLLSRGEAAEPLWDRVQGEMTFGTALDLILRADRLAAQTGITDVQAVIDVLDEYDRRPNKHILGNGKAVRKGTPRPRGKRASQPEAPPPEPVPEPEMSVPALDTGDDFWVGLNKALVQYARERADGKVTPEIEDLLKDFEGELKTAFNSFRSRLQNALSRGKKRITLQEVEEACELLGADPPRPGEWPDMDTIKKNYRNLIKVYHPDSGNPEQKDVYTRIVQSYALIQDYIKQISVGRTKDGRGRL